MTPDRSSSESTSPVSRFSVEPRLILQLGAQYRSTEEALRELVANAWDADEALDALFADDGGAGEGSVRVRAVVEERLEGEAVPL